MSGFGRPSSTGRPRPQRPQHKTDARASSAPRARPTSRSVKPLPADVPFLAEFADPDALSAVDGSEWSAVSQSLRTSVAFEVETHVSKCSKCRSFSVFSKNNGSRGSPTLTEGPLGTICRDGQRSLDRLVRSALTKEKDAMYRQMQSALHFEFDPAVVCMENRNDASFLSSLSLCKAELDRVLKVAPRCVDVADIVAQLDRAQTTAQRW